MMRQVGYYHSQLEEIKAREKQMIKLAEQFKNAQTVIRGQDGKVVDVEDLKESKQRELNRLNEQRVGLS